MLIQAGLTITWHVKTTSFCVAAQFVIFYHDQGISSLRLDSNSLFVIDDKKIQLDISRTTQWLIN